MKKLSADGKLTTQRVEDILTFGKMECRTGTDNIEKKDVSEV